jgi:hypothetical protein
MARRGIGCELRRNAPRGRPKQRSEAITISAARLRMTAVADYDSAVGRVALGVVMQGEEGGGLH